MESKELNNKENTWESIEYIPFCLGLLLIAVGIASFLFCRYGYLGGSIPAPFSGYYCFLFFAIPGFISFVIPLNWNLRATAIVAAAGIFLNVLVADYSTKQIRFELGLKTKEATKEIQEALFSKRFLGAYK